MLKKRKFRRSSCFLFIRYISLLSSYVLLNRSIGESLAPFAGLVTFWRLYSVAMLPPAFISYEAPAYEFSCLNGGRDAILAFAERQGLARDEWMKSGTALATFQVFYLHLRGDILRAAVRLHLLCHIGSPSEGGARAGLRTFVWVDVRCQAPQKHFLHSLA